MRVKVLQAFTMGNMKCLEGQEIEVEDWRAVRLSGEGLAVVIGAPKLPPVETEKEPAPKKISRRKK